MKIWANCLVYNEENFIWFAVSSVILYVDKILIWDTGSTDKTWEIINLLKEKYPDKIDINQCGQVDKYQFTSLRQQMLDQSDCDWILILDGDEIWWNNGIKKLTEVIKKNGIAIESIVVPFYNSVGDLYHYQSENKGRYKILGKTGHLTIRAINKTIPGLHLANPYGSEGFFDKDKREIQTRNSSKIKFLNIPYLHVTHLSRSSKAQKSGKFKYDLGQRMSDNFKLPEVFFEEFPDIIKNPFYKRSIGYKIKSLPRLLKLG